MTRRFSRWRHNLSPCPVCHMSVTIAGPASVQCLCTMTGRNAANKNGCVVPCDGCHTYPVYVSTARYRKRTEGNHVYCFLCRHYDSRFVEFHGKRVLQEELRRAAREGPQQRQIATESANAVVEQRLNAMQEG